MLTPFQQRIDPQRKYTPQELRAIVLESFPCKREEKVLYEGPLEPGSVVTSVRISEEVLRTDFQGLRFIDSYLTSQTSSADELEQKLHADKLREVKVAELIPSNLGALGWISVVEATGSTIFDYSRVSGTYKMRTQN